MNKKVVVLGGGTGISYLLKGLKYFPVDITAVITVADNGRSTGKLREEFNIPAVGDIRKVITNLSLIDDSIKEMMSYRFHTSSDLDGHALGNLILTAMLDITGSLKNSIAQLSKLLDVRHKVLPLSEDANLTLEAIDYDGNKIVGEEQITASSGKIKELFYSKEPKVLDEVLQSIKKADLIIFSMGSLYTSILPNLICKDVIDAINKAKAPIMYLANLMTQSGETDDFTVSDHIKILNKHLNPKKVDVVIANNGKILEKLAKKYKSEEEKDPVLIDYEEIEKLKTELIEDNIVIIDKDNTLKHDSIKISSIIFSYLMRK